MQTIPYSLKSTAVQYSALLDNSFLCHLLKLLYIVSECDLVLAASRALYLVCVLQLFNPFGFLGLELGYLPLDLLPPWILLIDSLNQLHPLRLVLHFLLVIALGHRIRLLSTDHVFHLLVMHALSILLKSNHFLMLLALMLQPEGLVLRLHQHRLGVPQDVVVALLLEVVILGG